METTYQSASPVTARNHSPSLFQGLGWGVAGGLAGTLVMDLLLMGLLLALKQPAFLCFTIVGDTVARFLAILGAHVTGGVPAGVATHYIVGPLLGIFFGAAVARFPALRGGTLKRIMLAAFLYVEILSQPILATTPVLLKMKAPAILLWFGGSFFFHLVLSLVLGVIVWYGLCSARRRSGSDTRLGGG